MRQHRPVGGAARALVWVSVRLVVGVGSVWALLWLASVFIWLLTVSFANIRPYVPPA